MGRSAPKPPVAERIPTTFERRAREKQALPCRLVAYDFETTRIAVGTPRPLYLTAHGVDPDFSIDTAIKDMRHALLILERHFLTPEMYGVKYIAWHGNNYDAYFIAAILLQSDEYIIRPYMTKSKSVRGLRIVPKAFADDPKPPSWEFLDAAAMIGLAGVKLSKFLQNFAPELPKMTDAIDFSKEEFDANNPKHRAYAYRDSEGLCVAMMRAQSIMIDYFNQPLTVTMGGACIRIFQSHMPRGIKVRLPRDEVLTAVREYVMRGGFCFFARRYEGPVWKYDINQAYAAAMREAKLPAGFTAYSKGKPTEGAGVYIARVVATNPDNIVPFYHRTEIAGKLKSVFSIDEIPDTWLTSIEIDQLLTEGWRVRFLESYSWDTYFNMSEFVDKLETLRSTCEGGPSGPRGTMVKATGNHAYGKTVEVIEPIEFMIASECPPDYAPYYGDDIETPLEHTFFRFVEDQRPKDYHQPQIGAFITAHVRMFLRRTILVRPQDWIYADTDCVVFTSDVTDLLDIHPTRYGAYKIEEAGTHYQFIAKKVYRSKNTPKPKRSSKGLRVDELTDEDFERWYHGEPPEQLQVQRNNFLKVMRGAEMFRSQLRSGTGKTRKSKRKLPKESA